MCAVVNRAQGGTTYFEHPDSLGTTRLRTDYQGNTAATFGSLPFGDGNSSTVNEANGAQEYTPFAELDLDNESNTGHSQLKSATCQAPAPPSHPNPATYQCI